MRCPEHNLPLELRTDAPVFGGSLYVCPNRLCDYSRMPERQRVDLKLPADPGLPQRKIIIREDPFQSALVDALRRGGYIVLVTSRVHKRAYCSPDQGGCGRSFWAHNADGCDKGVPDLLVTREEWPPYTLIGVEAKGTDTLLRPEQAALAESGRIFVSRAEGSIDASVQSVLSLLLSLFPASPPE